MPLCKFDIFFVLFSFLGIKGWRAEILYMGNLHFGAFLEAEPLYTYLYLSVRLPARPKSFELLPWNLGH